jgi:hypothetical protein
MPSYVMRYQAARVCMCVHVCVCVRSCATMSALTVHLNTEQCKLRIVTSKPARNSHILPC